MRKIAIVIGIIVIVLVLAVGIFVATFNPNDYRGTVQTNWNSSWTERLRSATWSLDCSRCGLRFLIWRSPTTEVRNPPVHPNPGTQCFRRADSLVEQVRADRFARP